METRTFSSILYKIVIDDSTFPECINSGFPSAGFLYMHTFMIAHDARNEYPLQLVFPIGLSSQKCRRVLKSYLEKTFSAWYHNEQGVSSRRRNH